MYDKKFGRKKIMNIIKKSKKNSINIIFRLKWKYPKILSEIIYNKSKGQPKVDSTGFDPQTFRKTRSKQW